MPRSWEPVLQLQRRCPQQQPPKGAGNLRITDAGSLHEAAVVAPISSRFQAQELASMHTAGAGDGSDAKKLAAGTSAEAAMPLAAVPRRSRKAANHGKIPALFVPLSPHRVTVRRGSTPVPCTV